MKKILLAVSCWLLAISIHAQYGDQQAVTIAGFQGLLHLPATYAASHNSYPLIIQDPGVGEHTINDIKNKYIAQYFTNNTWDGTAMNFKTGNVDSFIVFSLTQSMYSYTALESLLAALQSSYRIDANSYNLTGFSGGGQLTTWYPAHIKGAFPTQYFTPAYKLAACVVFSAESNPTDPLDNTVTDNVPFWGFGDSTGIDPHSVATLANMAYLNNLQSGFAVVTKHALGHSTGDFYSPTYTKVIGGHNMNVYNFMLYNKRAATLQTIITGAVSGPFCVTPIAGASVVVPFSSSVTYTSGNVFTAQLSDSLGGFSNPVNIGTLTTTINNGYINCAIPANTKSGTKYRIRVISSLPAVIGSLNNTNIVINDAVNSITPAAVQNISVGTNGFTLTVNDAGATSHVWKYGTSPTAINTSLSNTTASYTPNFTAGTYYVQCTSGFACGTALSNVVQINVTSSVIKNVRIYPTKGGDNGIYINGCNGFQYHAGDTIVLTAAQNPYSYISFNCIDSVTVINEGGQVITTCFNNCAIQGGFSFTTCTHIHLTGTGTPGVPYGFYNTSPSNRGVGVQADGRSAWFEIDHVECYNKNAGYWIKEEQQYNNCDPNLGFPNWILHDFKLHDNYVHNMSAEGMYLGSTAPNGTAGTQHASVFCKNGTSSTDSTAGSVADNVLPMRLANFEIYNNVFDSTGRAPIQLSDADSGMSYIHDNHITRCGFEYNTDQGNAITTGSYTIAKIYNNYIDSTFTDGIRTFGAYSEIYNNTILNSGYLHGHVTSAANININDPTQNIVSPGHTTPDSTTFIIHDNTYGNKTGAYNITANNQTPAQWSHASKICGGTYNIPGGIPFSTDCGTQNYIIHYDTAHVNYDTIKIKTTKKHYTVTRYADSAKVKLEWAWFVHGVATKRTDTLLKMIYSAPYPFDSVVTKYDTSIVVKCCHDSAYTDTAFVSYQLGVFYLNPGGTVSFQHVMDTANYIGVKWLRLNYNRNSGAPYNVGVANTNGFNVLLTLNNSSDGASGYNSYADSLINVAAPKWITGDNEPAINDSANIAAHLNDLSALITVAHNHGIKVTEGGFEKTIMLNYVKDLQTRGKTDSATTIISSYSLNMTSAASLHCMSKNDSLLNAYATMPLDGIALHWPEPGTTVSGYLPFVGYFIYRRTGKHILITESGTYNNDCNELSDLIHSELQLVPAMPVIYEDGAGADGLYVKLQDCFKGIVTLLP